VPGRLTNTGRADPNGAAFVPHAVKFFTLSLTGPYIRVLEFASMCLDCGLVYSAVSPREAVETVRTWGTDDLKARVLPQDGLPIPADESRDSTADLPLPSEAAPRE